MIATGASVLTIELSDVFDGDRRGPGNNGICPCLESEGVLIDLRMAALAIYRVFLLSSFNITFL